MIVADSNVLAARFLTSARTGLAQHVELIDHVWILPPLWRCEFQNVLVKSIWAKQMTPGDAAEVWRQAYARMSTNEREPSAEQVIELSARHRITAYDANFIALAIEMNVQCVTEDSELLEKFPAIAVSMENFVTRDTGGSVVRETRTAYGTPRKRRNK